MFTLAKKLFECYNYKVIFYVINAMMKSAASCEHITESTTAETVYM